MNTRLEERLTGQVMTAAEVAARLKVSSHTVIRLMSAGKLPGVRVGSVWRCRTDLLEAFLQTGKVLTANAEAVKSVPSE